MLWANDFAALEYCPPVLTLRVIKSRPTWDEYRELQDSVRVFYTKADAQNRRICLLFDLQELGVLIPAMVQEWIDLFDELKEKTRRIIVCSAMVIASQIIRTAIDRFMQGYDAVRPIYICASVEEARDRCLASAHADKALVT